MSRSEIHFDEIHRKLEPEPNKGQNQIRTGTKLGTSLSGNLWNILLLDLNRQLSDCYRSDSGCHGSRRHFSSSHHPDQRGRDPKTQDPHRHQDARLHPVRLSRCADLLHSGWFKAGCRAPGVRGWQQEVHRSRPASCGSGVCQSRGRRQVEPNQQVQSEGGYDSDERSGSDPTPAGTPGCSQWRKVTCSPASEPERIGSSPPPVPLPSRCSRGAGIPDPDAAWTCSSRRSCSADSHHPTPLSSEPQTQPPSDAAPPRCPRCLCCPSDPFARFCSQCGAVIPPVPALWPPPAGRGQLLPCPSCRCLVPINSRTCWTCEASTEGSRAGFSLQVNLGGGGAPSGGPGDSSMWSCSRCRRLNRHDARFCDRCGTKVGHAPCWVTCWRCGASAPPDAPHCVACGVFLLALAPPTPCSDITPPEEDAAHSQSPAPRQGVAPPPVDRSTQTVGLYYPSATELQQRDQQRALWRRREAERINHRPPLSAVSPGRGYWRNQVDHVCAHLRSYTQNRASFRTLLAEPRLGRMVSALVQQNQDEMVLTLSFSLAANQNRQQVGPDDDPDSPAGSSTVPGRVQKLSSVTQRATDRAGSPGRKRDSDLEPDLLDEELCRSGF
ncbi:double zinc ribbon and ankyrin repeat-containing protein 1 isoform X2 [Gambusia affinis]|uniref:double zinc ribbon and ankyrin repeat-containing protein 1 isoform X2 n=1 Tax=Gambusia affinis TaxID=33528 RepID=UPI001CDD6F00|nr:double zinc ribbon and ankyrin repeat-containing protein 1 isoform X2 [Gambusia affinis]